MKISITSSRGHHEAVADVETARCVFEKLTGKRKDPLPRTLKIPDTFGELEALWKEGGGGYTALAKNKVGDLSLMKEFDPTVEDVAFIAPVVGG